MKRFVLIALLLTAWAVPAAAHDVKTVTRDDLVQRNGLFYEKFSNTPFNGTTTGQFKKPFKNGRLHGVEEIYNSRGQLSSLITYKDGIRHGKALHYHDNCKLHEEATYKSDLKDGPYVLWWYNGQLRAKGVYEAGTREGRWMDFHEDETPDLKKTGTYQMDVRIGP